MAKWTGDEPKVVAPGEVIQFPRMIEISAVVEIKWRVPDSVTINEEIIRERIPKVICGWLNAKSATVQKFNIQEEQNLSDWVRSEEDECNDQS